MSTKTGLKDSDYFQMGAIASGIVGASAFVGKLPDGFEIAGLASLFAAVAGALSQYLQSKGY